MVYLTRKAEFSASHYYDNPEFSAEENRRIFGKCNNPNGHGHNYTLEVTVKGEVDPRSGFVVDLKQLKEILNREVLDAMDHRFLNKEVPEFSTRIPTTENLAIAIWERLASKLCRTQLACQSLPDRNGQVFRGRNPGGEFGHFLVQKTVVHGVQHFAVQNFLQLLQINNEAGSRINLPLDRDFEGVVVAVAVRVVAFAEDAPVFFRTELRIV